MSLSAYRTLGRSGLSVSPLCLGTMTFGTARWGTGEDASRAIFDAYIEAGGNFVDTADVYAGGRSEELLGAFISERGLRDRIVVATKAGFAVGDGVHAGGIGAKHVHAALEGSLRRLRTDHVDLYWLHVWDGVTPAEELLQTMTGLVRSGKVRYWGMSNAPAWYVAQLATLASAHALPGPVAIQSFYSLIDRDLEREHMPMARRFGIGVMPWSPLAYGLLTGKYERAAVEASAPRPAGLPCEVGEPSAKRSVDDKRLDGPNPFGDTLFTQRNWRIVEGLKTVAAEIGETPARIALAWVVGQAGVTSTLLGVSRAGQVLDNAGAVDLVLDGRHRAALDEISGPDSYDLYALFSSAMRRQVVFGGQSVEAY